MKEQPAFYNMVVEAQTELEPKSLFHTIKEIETAIGRTTSVRWGPREIDIDLLYFDSAVISDPEFQVPHPEIANRNFVLIPLAEIDGSFIDPRRRQPIRSLLAASLDRSAVKRLDLVLSLSH